MRLLLGGEQTMLRLILGTVLFFAEWSSAVFFNENDNTNNVCDSLQDYATITTNKNCRFDPDVQSSPIDIARRYGYPLEKHKVTSEGYILTIFRIPAKNSRPYSRRESVLLQHGIGGTAIFWMLQGQNSLAFVLSRNGYDVWLPTIRGGTYSDQHEKLTVSDPEYWNFSFHEMALHDLPLITEYISNITRYKSKIIYIGHSMGTTISYIYSNAMNEHAKQHLEGLISLSPVIYTKNMRGITPLITPFAGAIQKLLEAVGIYAIGYQPIFIQIVSKLCGTYPGILLCELSLVLANGLSLKETRPDLLPVFFNNFPRGTSLKTLNHFAQCIRTGTLQMYDYGSKNILKYNSSKPPSYDNDANRIPSHFFVGIKDFLATKEDADSLYRRMISNGVSTSVNYFNYAHNDFFLGRNFDDLYETLFKVMGELSKT